MSFYVGFLQRVWSRFKVGHLTLNDPITSFTGMHSY